MEVFVTQVPNLNLRDTGEDLFEDLTPDERSARILERELPHLCNDIGMLVARPFKLIWDPTIETASTDCMAEVRLAPWPFIEGRREIGYGSAYHETGHILFSSYGTNLLGRARKEGGAVLQHILNIILDRKDDMQLADHAPGFKETLRNRLLYICTLAQRRKYQAQFEGDEENFERMLRHIRPADPYEDFFFAAKWHKRPRFKTTAKAMRYLRRSRLLEASPDELLWIARQVRKILGRLPEKERNEAEGQFVTLYGLAVGIECNVPGKKLSAALSQALQNVMAKYVAGLRQGGMKQLLSQLKSMSMVWPGPLSVGLVENVPVKQVLPNASYGAKYTEFLGEVRDQVEPLVRRLRLLDNPAEFELYGRDEGELDLSEAARIATGLSGFYLETVVERNIDAEVHLAIDYSSSMALRKIQVAKRIATVFSEAILTLAPAAVGNVWGFNSEAILDFGPVSRQSGFVTLEGSEGNSDTHMLSTIGKRLAQSRKRRKVLLVLCDDGPDDIEKVKRLSRQLTARGILVIHLLVGVHGTPDIYPVELLYTTIEECLREFGDLIEMIIGHLR
jgi:hypothetical protein